ncbi:hypothetical protein V2J09_001880 [Rumex salicifolius]
MASSSKPQTLKRGSFYPPTVKAGDPAACATMPDNPSTSVLPGVLTPPMEESSPSESSYLTRQEVLLRRRDRVKKLSRVYRDYYWALMEELKVMNREYYWKYGVSPYKEDEERNTVGSVHVEGSGETNKNNRCSFGGRNNNGGGDGGKLGLGFEENGGIGFELKYGGYNLCAFVGCKLKAMALTAFCHLHILSDPHQKLYKACNYVIKSAQAGPIICGKPILRSTVSSLCNAHFEKDKKQCTRALRKAGLTSSSSKLPPKFHVIVAEYVHQIKSKRRALQKPSRDKMVVKEECDR